MNKNFEIVNTSERLISVVSNPDSSVEVEFMIIRENGKYGLSVNFPVAEDKNEQILTLPIEYDNLFFVEVNFTSYLIAVVFGKQGVFKLELDETENNEIIPTEILPFEYDRIVTFRNDQLFLLYRGDLICCYDPVDETYFAECNHIEKLYDSYYLCTKNDESVVWDTIVKRPVFTIKQSDCCEYIGSYKQGEVFKITYYDDNNYAICQQLLFYSYQRGHDVHLSPKAERIILHTRVGNENRVVGIDMSWGDWDSPIDINEICKEKVL